MQHMAEIKKADTDEKILSCLGVIQSLRPHITEDNILDYVHTMQKENYHILYIEDNGKPVAFSGYRFITHFFTGAGIYIDDLGTLADYRGKGYGGRLLDHICNIAKEKNLHEIRLDSGHHRYDAHRLYLNKGYNIVSHHFKLAIKEL
ncbi:MAG: GNAT family N-acetyltransferase [Chitinophagales bacterium]|nr:GNAT family N-acetyltransferase [Chitinophagales bacterium]